MGEKGDLSAFNKKTGELVWQTDVTPTPHGNPMTYLFEEKQYIVLAAGGGNLTGGSQPAQLIAFSLP